MSGLELLVLALIVVIAAYSLALLGIAMVTLSETVLWWHRWRSVPIKAIDCPLTGKLIVFVSGTSDYASASLYDEQISLLDDLKALLPDYQVCFKPFPFQDSTASWCQRFGYWPQTNAKYRLPLSVIAMRNFWQSIFMSTAKGAYSRDMAKVLVELVAKSQCRELFLVCGSSGIAMAANSARLIKQKTGCRIYAASFGGVQVDREGLSCFDSHVSIESKSDKWHQSFKNILGRKGDLASTSEAQVLIDGPGHMQYLEPQYRHVVAQAMLAAVPKGSEVLL